MLALKGQSVDMGIGVRPVILDDDGVVKRFSAARLERLLNRCDDERLEHCAGRGVRFAIAYVDFQDRVLFAILRIEYVVLTFDSAGQLDSEILSKYDRLGIEAISSLLDLDGFKPNKIVDLLPRLARRRLEQEFHWSPTADLEEEFHRVVPL
jgi:hypothetical protein